MPKYTDEQVERAKNADVRTFLEQTEGYTFAKSGKYLKCKDPDKTGQPSSLSVDTKMNRIFYNSVTGNRPLSAIDWCKEIKGMDFQSSIKLIIGENPQGERVERPAYKPFKPQEHTNDSEGKVFSLPEKAESSKHVYAYLTATRGIPEHIVNSCIKKGLIMEDIRKNAVFVGYDDNNEPKYAARRGTFTPDGKEPFKRDVSGSDKNFAFKLVGKNTDTIYVTEAAIDALSLAAIEDKFHGQWSFTNMTFISTGGAGMDKAIEQFCKTHDVKTINICFDNDEAGKNGMEKIMQKFREQGYVVNDMRASLAHDYNDELIQFNKNPNFYTEYPLTAKNTIQTERNNDMPEVNMPEPEQTEHEQTAIPNAESINVHQQPIPEPSEIPYLPIDETDIPPDDYYYIPDEPPADYGQTAPQIPEPPVSAEEPQRIPTAQNTQQEKKAEEQPQKKEEPSLKPKPAVEIGNTPYTKIPDKKHITNISPDISTNVFTRLQAENIQFFGKLTGSGVTIAVSQSNHERAVAIISEENAALAERKQKEQERPVEMSLNETKPPSEMTEKTAVEEVTVTDEQPIQLENASREEKMNFLLASLKDRQESKRAALLDKLDGIDSKMTAHEDKIQKLSNKSADLETSLKTLAALKRAFSNTVVAGVIDISIENRRNKIKEINETKIPKHEEKIGKLNEKKTKSEERLGKVNRKIDGIDKVQKFISAISSPDREERHKGFVTGLENLSEYRRESLLNKAENIANLRASLTDKMNNMELSHTEKYEIEKVLAALSTRADEIADKIRKLDKLGADLTDIKDGKFTVSELDVTVEKTADKISARLENNAISDGTNVVDHVIEQSVEAGSEAIDETAAEQAVKRGERVNPELEHERAPEKKQPDVSKDFEKGVLTAAAALTGIAISEINRLPAEVKAEIVSEFQQSGGNVSAEKLAEKICDIAEIEPPPIIQSAAENNAMKNPMREQEMVQEQDWSQIDGIINNLPQEQPRESKSGKDAPLFSRTRIMSDEFKPTSSKSREEIEQDRAKHKGDMSLS